MQKNYGFYLHYKKYTKTKNITKKTLKVKWNRRNTYLLNWWRFTRKVARDCWWNFWRMERKIIGEKLRRRKNELKRRLGDLYGSFTDGFTDGYKINYYFNLFSRWSVKNPSVNFEFRTKIFNDSPFVSWSIGNSLGTMTRSEMHLMHNPLEFARSVGNFVGKLDPSTTYGRTCIRRYWCRWLWHFK